MTGVCQANERLNKLMRVGKWQACPKCKRVIEKSEGLSEHAMSVWDKFLLWMWSRTGRRKARGMVQVSCSQPLRLTVWGPNSAAAWIR
jgi:hypothetical protein